MKETIEIIKKAVDASSDYEKANTEIKREYIVSNIILYNTIASLVEESRGTFGTGYPFYILDKDLQGALPVINEQLRYNEELAKTIFQDYSKNNEYKEWRCATCLREKGELMPDLKQICINCPQVADAMKPRKVINRLPDLDMWMVCSKDEIVKASNNLESILKNFGFSTSDVDPIKTIYEIQDIAHSLKYGEKPNKRLPIDTHIIDHATLYTLISQIPDTLDYCFRHDQVPYLPIHPLSLRKTWQKDDSAYNFVHDYLSSFTEFKMDDTIQDLLNSTRKEIAKKYSFDKLYDFLLSTGPESVARRHETPELKEAFEKRIESWHEL